MNLEVFYNLTAILKVLLIAFMAMGCFSVEASGDMDLLNGEWQAQSLEIEGKSASPEAVESIHITIKNGKLLVRLDKDYYREKEGLIKIDSTKSPKHIDVSPAGDQSESVLGIYEVNNETLKICLNANSGVQRPQKFETEAGSEQILIVFKKLK